MNDRCRALIDRLQLQPHPEGGFYRETYRASIDVPASALPDDYGAARSLATVIHFLLPAGTGSQLHRVRSEELWIFIEGDPVRLRDGRNAEALDREVLLHHDHELQHLVPANWWQEAAVTDGPRGYGLVACLVVPGFDFADFTMK